MKVSLKLEEDQNPFFKAKIPVTIFNHPFLSTIANTSSATAIPSHFSLSTHFPSGPSLQLSYHSATTSAAAPFSLRLKSGLGPVGSPTHSPLVFSACLSFSPSNPTLAPIFSLHFKPQLGHFSLRKTISSNPNPKPLCSNPVLHSNPESGNGSMPDMPLGSKFKSHSKIGGASDDGFGSRFVPEMSSGWEELKLETFNGKDGFAKHNPRGDGGAHSKDRVGKANNLFGVAAVAKTVFPLTKRVAVKLQWGVNLWTGSSSKIPYLTVNKISLERSEEVNEVKNGADGKVDQEFLKRLCFWMKRDVELLEKENRELQKELGELRSDILEKNSHGKIDAVGNKKIVSLAGNSTEVNRRRSKQVGREGTGQRESKKSADQAGDVESELQRAIRAATTV